MCVSQDRLPCCCYRRTSVSGSSTCRQRPSTTSWKKRSISWLWTTTSTTTTLDSVGHTQTNTRHCEKVKHKIMTNLKPEGLVWWRPCVLSGMVYFTVASQGAARGAIKRAYIPSVDDGSNNIAVAVDLGIRYITTPDGIAVDWVGRFVWTDVSEYTWLHSLSTLLPGTDWQRVTFQIVKECLHVF